MKIQVLTGGNLKMHAGNLIERRDIGRMHHPETSKTESRFVKRFLSPYGYKEIKPEDCGALTSATCITDGKNVWADMNYQIRSFIKELSAGNEVIWTRG
jgi:hypothetical protein